MKGRVQSAKNARSLDVTAWEWLAKLISQLGRDGMSSDESEPENGAAHGRIDYVVKKIPWRKDITKELAIIDGERMKDKDIYSKQGSKPVPRLRTQNAPTSSRLAPAGLPSSFFDAAWYASLNEAARRDLHVAARDFHWIDITTECSV